MTARGCARALMKEAFQIVVLGCTGGPRENNISGFLISPLNTSQWIALDAGSLLTGIESALAQGSLQNIAFTDPLITPAYEMLIKHLKGYLITHAHLDHISGLVLNSQIDSKKYILGTHSTIDNLRDHIFNGKIWPNYGNEGVEPIISRYQYVRLNLHEQTKIPDTKMTVEAYRLSHPNGYPSTAFLVEFEGRYLLCFGDTASDFAESEKHLTRIWHRIAPLLKNGSLHGLLLECSFPHEDVDQVIYGHLDTHLLMRELHQLAEIAATSPKGLNVLITHRKECLKKGKDALFMIEQELTALNDLGIHFYFPKQGDYFTF